MMTPMLLYFAVATWWVFKDTGDWWEQAIGVGACLTLVVASLFSGCC